MYRRLSVVAFLLLAVTVGACRRESPEPPPPPPPPAQQDPGPDLAEQQRIQDSIAAARAAAEEAERQRLAAIASARAILEQRVHFDYDESRIRPDAEQVLRQKVEILRASPDVRIRLEGHTDERGSGEYNQALGTRRAQAVLNYFLEYGISESRFTMTSFGEERPLVNRSDEAAWAQNRRVEFIITAGADRINPPGSE
jgi:peptidoglycan-associated lipoprotein